MTFLHKLLPLGVLPVGITLLLLGIGAVRKRWSFVWAAMALLWVLGMPLMSEYLQSTMEGPMQRRPATAAPNADAIVVLSEGRTIAPGTARISEWTDADRFFGGIELFRAGKAGLLVFTGGAGKPAAAQPAAEGDVLTAFAVQLGVAKRSILVTGPVENTADEAQAVSSMLKQVLPTGRALTVHLVTSAMHMSRARRLFERTGLEVFPFPVDFKSAEEHTSFVLRLLPTASALAGTEAAAREMLGRMYYRVGR